MATKKGAPKDWVRHAQSFAGRIDVGGNSLIGKTANNGGKPVSRGESVPGTDLRPERRKKGK